jgi:hypothetical protein
MHTIGRRTLVFTLLYGDTWAAFQGKATKGKRRQVIFPQGFTPEAGTQYECRLSETLTGEWRYKGEVFTVCRAERVDMPSSGEVSEYIEVQKVNRKLHPKTMAGLLDSALKARKESRS